MDYVSGDGDCDDTRADVHPGAEEVCDGVDNDCDEDLDEGFEDAWEDNDTESTETDLGLLSATTSATLAGITLDAAGDEDWFSWTIEGDGEESDAARETITLTEAPPEWTIEAESTTDDGTGTGVATETPYTSVTNVGTTWTLTAGTSRVQHETIWRLRIYTTAWTCASTVDDVTLTITSNR